LKKIQDYYGMLPFPLTEGQKYSLEEFTTGTGHYALGGVQGAGKSTVMALLSKFYGDEVIFCASSGTASKQMPDNIGSGTAHSIMSLFTEVSRPEMMSKVNRTTTALFAKSDLIKVVVVDEAFAMDSDKLYTMLHRIKRFNKRTNNRGERNIRLLLVGDWLQRLPILTEEEKLIVNEKHGHWLMFKSNPWKEADIKVLMLTEVKRQDDKIFKACLDVIRYGIEHRYEGALEWLNQRYSKEYDDTLLLLAPTNAAVKAANSLSLQRNPNPKGLYTSTITGKYNIKDSPLAKEVMLAVGSPVITVINHEEGDYCNGSYGHITGMESDGCWVRFSGASVDTFVSMVTLREEESYIKKDVLQEDGTYADEQGKTLVGTCTGLPILLAASYTIARSQGKTFSCKINIDVGNTSLYTSRKLGDFGTADVLVGLSRATSVDNITLLRKIEPKHIKVCRESIAFWYESLAKQEEKLKCLLK
jgi:hypothetical protein